jgi:small subunit ribosomal protein S5
MNSKFRRPKRTPIVKEFDKEAWQPKTLLGKDVKAGVYETIEDVFKSGKKIMEPEIIDCLIPNLKTKTIDVKKTTRVTRAGRHFSFRVTVVVGDQNGFVGVGTGKNIEKITAQEKAILNAKLNLVHVKRGCGSWECNCDKKHSVPYNTFGQCASLRVTLLPAPNGVGLTVSDTIKPVLELAGIKDVWSKTRGATDTKLNFVRATISALGNISKLKVNQKEVLKKETPKEDSKESDEDEE